MRRYVEPQTDIDSCGFPRISTAPGDLRNCTDSAVIAESKKLYAAQSTDGKIFLITNPACWKQSEIRPGIFIRSRPKPTPLNSYAPNTVDTQQSFTDKAEDFFKW